MNPNPDAHPEIFAPSPFRLEQAEAAYRQLAKALASSALNAAAIPELMATHIRASCVLCRIEITGEELETAALARDSADLQDARLQRIRQGYCSRRGCESYFYQFLFLPHPMVDWGKMMQIPGASDPGETGAATSEPSESPHAPESRKPLVRNVVIAAGCVLLLLAGWRFFSGGSLFGSGDTPKYLVNPPLTTHAR